LVLKIFRKSSSRVKEKMTNPKATQKMTGWKAIFNVSETSPDLIIFKPQTSTCQETIAKKMVVMK
jgi:hypothetical protein